MKYSKSNINNIPIQVVSSGSKYISQDGTVAIKDGVKSNKNNDKRGDKETLKKPSWIRIKAENSPQYSTVKQLVTENNLSTVCAEAKCPNISECWSHGTATIMLLGAICTRACKFCSVDTGNPHGKLDLNEPQNAAKTAKIMNLDYIVLTSVDRDDLADGGASQYANSIIEIKKSCPDIKVEALTPDFSGNLDAVKLILNSGVDVFAQNVETVKRLTHPVRDPRAGYDQTLEVLKFAKEYASQNNKQILTKTSLMLGLGESFEEVVETMDDLRLIDVDILTLGQYLQPTKNHLDVERYIPPEEFELLRNIGLEKGFFEVAAGPMVRSSYRADRVFKRDNLGL